MEAPIFGEPTLLLADDDEPFRTALGGALGRRGFAVTLAKDAQEAEEAARQQVFEYALVDVRMPGRSGIDLCAALRRIDEETRIVVLTGYGTIANAVEAMRAGAADYLTKPVDAAACVRALLGRSQAAPGNDGGLTRGATERGAPQTPGDEGDDVPSLERVEYEYLQRVLADCGGNISLAARRLRMHRRSFQRKITRQPPRR